MISPDYAKMNIIEWLSEGDAVIRYLTDQYLLEIPSDHHNKGYIEKYMQLYDPDSRLWGESIYTRKWICSTYTLLELKYMEIHPDTQCYQDAVRRVLDDLWNNHGKISRTRYQDMCMSAMVLSLVCYGHMNDNRVNEIVDYILAHQMVDGGWNCAWDSVHNRSAVGSVHTTLTVLEALGDYMAYGYAYRLDEIKKQIIPGQEYLLRRNLFRSLKTGDIIHPDMVHFHYPCRWKYDCFRALEYFVHVGHSYDSRMQDAMELVRAELKKGYARKGKRYPGQVHFPLEPGTKGRFNTYRALLILKHYDDEAYREIINTDFSY